jgi:dTDP-4-amino-4,6-dideoxygalactose transaminase
MRLSLTEDLKTFRTLCATGQKRLDLPNNGNSSNRTIKYIERRKKNMSQQIDKEATNFAPWPEAAADEIDAARRVLSSGKVNYAWGEEGWLFEKEFAAFVGCNHAIALANGTVALTTALEAVGISAGDEVIMSTRTLIDASKCVAALGARPMVTDVDRDSQNLTADTIRRMITPRTKAIMVAHLAGWPAEMDEIVQLAQDYGLKIIEDCAQATGAKYKGRPVGSIGDVAAFSFLRDGIMTTGGEGGMVTTNDPEVWARAWSYQDPPPEVHPLNVHNLPDLLTRNGRMGEVQCAIGRITLKKIHGWIETRRTYAALFNERLAHVIGIRLVIPPPHLYHSYYKFYLFVRAELLLPGWGRDRILGAICAENVPCFVGSCSDAYRRKAFIKERRDPSRLPIAQELANSSLMFLVHPTLDIANIEYARDVIEKVMASATKTGA